MPYAFNKCTQQALRVNVEDAFIHDRTVSRLGKLVEVQLEAPATVSIKICQQNIQMRYIHLSGVFNPCHQQCFYVWYNINANIRMCNTMLVFSIDDCNLCMVQYQCKYLYVISVCTIQCWYFQSMTVMFLCMVQYQCKYLHAR